MEKIFYNGRIYTLSAASPVAGAMVVRDGRIRDIGDDELLNSIPSGACRIDLNGSVVIPGLVDSHLHLMDLAVNRRGIDFAGTSSYQDLLGMVEDRRKKAKDEEWIVGSGWDQNRWPEREYPHRRKLDEITGNVPVFLKRVCGHAALVNQAALKRSGITGSSPDPPGGTILRDSGGEPTGILIDKAAELVSVSLPSPGAEEMCRLVEEAGNSCLKSGLVGVHDMGVSEDSFLIYSKLKREGRIPLRINCYWRSDQSVPEEVKELEEGGISSLQLGIRGVKLFSDGSLGARSAALLEDYSDDPGNRGILLEEGDELKRKIEEYHSGGLQTAVHAIGDRANRVVLDIFEEIFQRIPRRDIRHRIEHAQIVSPEDIPRFAKLGIIPSMQFPHLLSDIPWAKARVGRRRLKGGYAWKQLYEQGCPVTGGSDAPVVPFDPFHGIFAGTSDFGLEDNRGKDYIPSRAISPSRALESYTINPAYAVHQENQRGTLSRGKVADFVVISGDIMKMPARDIPRIEVIATVVGGELVYSSPGWKEFE